MVNNKLKTGSEKNIPKVLLVCPHQDTGPVWAYALRQKQLNVVLESSIENVILRWADVVPDLIILDIPKSDLKAIEIIRKLHHETANPILMLTSSQEEEYILDAYAAGVDECIIKPVSPMIFLAKTQSWLRRSWTTPFASFETMTAGNLRLIPAERVLVIGSSEKIKLTNLELRLLLILMSQPGQTFTTEDIVQRIWGYLGDSGKIVLKNVVYRLRNKMDTNPANPRYLLNVAGVGYKLMTG